MRIRNCHDHDLGEDIDDDNEGIDLGEDDEDNDDNDILTFLKIMMKIMMILTWVNDPGLSMTSAI